MAEAAVNLSAVKALAAMQVRIVGRVKAVDQLDDMVITQVVCPAADAYSMPATVAIRSGRRLGRPGEEIDVFCQLAGMPEQWTDKKTGELRHSARLWLSLVQ